MRGYSVSLIEEVKEVNTWAKDWLGSKLGMYCVENNIPISEVAKALGASRQSVYRWFTGRVVMSKKMHAKAQAYYDALPRPPAKHHGS